MKKMIVFSAMLASSAAWSATPEGAGTTTTSDPNQIVCQRIAETGSRLQHARVCRTRAEWAQQRHETRADVERTQALRGDRPAN